MLDFRYQVTNALRGSFAGWKGGFHSFTTIARCLQRAEYPAYILQAILTSLSAQLVHWLSKCTTVYIAR